MNVVFLDVDGVLNSRAFYDRVGGHPSPPLDPLAIERLQRLCTATQARICISSSWRGHPRLEAWLRERGLSAPILGITPHFGVTGNRGSEIAEWLGAWPLPVERFVILDDGDDMDHLLPYLVRTSHETGLLDEHVDRAVAMLTGE